MPAGCRAPGPPAARHRAPGSAAAIRRASARSLDSSWMFQAMRNGRAPTTVAPAVGCGRRGPKSGAPSSVASDAARPSNPGRRMSARTRRSGRVAARAYRKTGSSIALGQPCTERPGKVHAGVHGRVAEGHERHDVQRADPGMPAVLCAACRCARSPAPRRARVAAITASGPPAVCEHAPVVIGVRCPVEEHHAGRRARPRSRMASTTSATASLAEVGHAFDESTPRPESRCRRPAWPRPALSQPGPRAARTATMATVTRQHDAQPSPVRGRAGLPPDIALDGGLGHGAHDRVPGAPDACVGPGRVGDGEPPVGGRPGRGATPTGRSP